MIFEKAFPCVLRTPFGKGELIGVAFDLGLTYFKERTVGAKLLASKLFRYRNKRVNIEAHAPVSVVLKKKDNEDYIHILNLSGDHRAENIKSFDNIVAVGEVNVSFRTAEDVSEVFQLPENRPLAFSKEDNILRFKVPGFAIHTAIKIGYTS